MSIEPAQHSSRPDAAADPSGDRVEVRLVSTSSEAARRVAEALRLLFAGDEQRSYPADSSGAGTRLHLTLDASSAGTSLDSWLHSSSSSADRAHHGETA
ncbi:hypothetical protein [Streptomyces sp. NPDC006552]|uniref:hypothetical protein n=1 Tax=Streptomyces sp. NPDC006552 TaxID=3157179 RepID=UPI0033B47848